MGIGPFQLFQPSKTFQSFKLFKAGAGSEVNSSKVQGKINLKGELPRFENSQNVKMRIYFACPRRRRSSVVEMVPSFFARDLDRSMILRNLRLVLSARVSSSALWIGITAANGFPPL